MAARPVGSFGRDGLLARESHAAWAPIGVGLCALALWELVAMAPRHDLLSLRVAWSTFLLYGGVLTGAVVLGLCLRLGGIGLGALHSAAPRYRSATPGLVALVLVAGFGHGWPVVKEAFEPLLGRRLGLIVFGCLLLLAFAGMRRSLARSSELALALVGIFAAALGYYLLRAEPLGLPAPPRLAAWVCTGLLGAGVVAALRSRRTRVWRIVAVLALHALAVRWIATNPHGVVKATTAAAELSAPDSATPVFFLVVDTLRADALELDGRTLGSRTPQLARFAAQSDRFTNVVANGSWTIPGHASLFTGRRVSAHRVDLTSVAGFGSKLDPSLPTLHERFAGAGYRTVCISANGIVGPGTGLVRGCARYRHPGRAWTLQSLPLRLWYALSPSARPALEEQFLVELTGLRRHATADEVVDLALEELGEPGETVSAPYVFLNFMDVHKPYPAPSDLADSERRALLVDLVRVLLGLEPPETFDREHAAVTRRYYDAQVVRLDAELGRFFDALRERGLWNDALVIVTSDHGEAFYDNAETPLYYDHHGGYEAAVRIPLLVKRPGESSPRNLDHLVEQANIAPAVIELAGLVDPSSTIGVLYDPRLERTALTEWNPHPTPGAMSTLPYRRVGLYRDRLKVVLERPLGATWESATESLFDLDRSPFEERALTRGGVSSTLRAELLGTLAREWAAGAGLATSGPEPDPGLIENLRSLGYID